VDSESDISVDERAIDFFELDDGSTSNREVFKYGNPIDVIVPRDRVEYRWMVRM
jgi:hypothetical protein